MAAKFKQGCTFQDMWYLIWKEERGQINENWKTIELYVVVELLTILLHNREVPGSNFGLEIAYNDKIWWFS
jgi:hypothetical protein